MMKLVDNLEETNMQAHRQEDQHTQQTSCMLGSDKGVAVGAEQLLRKQCQLNG